jgi:hypothetical protein
LNYFFFSEKSYINQYKGLLNSIANKGYKFGIINAGGILETKYSYPVLNISPKNKDKILFWESVLNYARIKNQENLSYSFKERLSWTVKDYAVLRGGVIEILKRNKKGVLYYLRKYFRQNKFSIYVNVCAKIKWLHDLMFFVKIRDKYFFSELDKLNINRIIFCFQGPHAETHLLLKYAKYRNIDLIFYQHNWDNISSKEVLNLHPDKILVWSYQCLLHATSILKILEDKVVISGNYRLDAHLLAKQILHDQKNPSEHSQNKVLLLGDSTDFDEYKILELISEILVKYGDNWVCEYRPHPYLNKKKFTQTTIPKNIEIDKQFAIEYFQEDNKSGHDGFLKRLTSLDSNEFVEQVSKSDFVIVGGSTITLECLVIGKPVILINSKIRAVDILDKTHFFGIDKLEGVIKINEGELNINKLEDAMFRIQKTKVDPMKLKYYYDTLNSNFEKTIIELFND